MSKSRVLITCPPMLRMIDRFEDVFAAHGWDVTAPDIIQQMETPDLIRLLPEFDGWIIGDDDAGAEVLTAGAAGRLRACVRWGIGVDNVDFDAAKRLNIPIRNTPGMFGAEVGDLALHYLTGLFRRTFEIDRGVRAGKWTKFAGTSLAGSRVGLVGYGDIGRSFARRAAAADIALTVYDPGVSAKDVAPFSQAQWPDNLDQLDALVFTCALTDSSKHMLNADRLAKLPAGAMIVNVARGGLVDEPALEAALGDGHIAAAALDVFETEPVPATSALLGHPRCIFGSHNGSNTIQGVERASYRAIELMEQFLQESQARA